MIKHVNKGPVNTSNWEARCGVIVESLNDRWARFDMGPDYYKDYLNYTGHTLCKSCEILLILQNSHPQRTP